MRMKEDRGAESPGPTGLQRPDRRKASLSWVQCAWTGRDTLSDPASGKPAHLFRSSSKKLVTDAGYGSEENYAYLEEHALETSSNTTPLPGYPLFSQARTLAQTPVPGGELA